MPLNSPLKKTLERIKKGSTEREIGRQYSTEDLRAGLKQTEKVKYRKNGNRALKGEKFLKILTPALHRIGVTRAGNISDLAATQFPVFQSCRPNVFYHTEMGQNTGGQGKGYSDVQAKLSCFMETIESYCAEPRNPTLIRGSYNFLKKQHQIVHPSYVHSLINTSPTEKEPIMWTPAYSVALDTEVLVPAQAIYFPFLTLQYNTRPLYPSSSNGLASGATYLEAVIHGLYEVIERHYLGAAEAGLCKIEALHEEELAKFGIEELADAFQGEYELQLFSYKLKGLRKNNLPMIMCRIVGEERLVVGHGCSSVIDVSISRAISEALQSIAVKVSGAREDMSSQSRKRRLKDKSIWPKFRSLRYCDYKNQVIDRKFSDLHAEYLFIVKWLSDIGHPEICISNLTRAGIEVPVVKVLVPSLSTELTFRYSGFWKMPHILERQFRI